MTRSLCSSIQTAASRGCLVEEGRVGGQVFGDRPRFACRSPTQEISSSQAEPTQPKKIVRANSHSEGGVMLAIATGEMQLPGKRIRREGSYRGMSKK